MKKNNFNPSKWQGSQSTYNMVFNQIKSRYGEKEAHKYDPSRNCLTYRSWLDRGLRVKRGEKALKSITFIPVEIPGKPTAVYKKTVNLFYYLQLERIIS